MRDVERGDVGFGVVTDGEKRRDGQWKSLTIHFTRNDLSQGDVIITRRNAGQLDRLADYVENGTFTYFAASPTYDVFDVFGGFELDVDYDYLNE